MTIEVDLFWDALFVLCCCRLIVSRALEPVIAVPCAVDMMEEGPPPAAAPPILKP